MCRNSRQPLTGSMGSACPEKDPSLCKREILPHFNLHRSTERTLVHAADSSKHMCY